MLGKLPMMDTRAQVSKGSLRGGEGQNMQEFITFVSGEPSEGLHMGGTKADLHFEDDTLATKWRMSKGDEFGV